MVGISNPPAAPSAAAARLARGVAVQPSAVTTAAGLGTALAPVSLPASAPISGVSGNQIIVDTTELFQTFYGVGAAITDSAAYVLTNYLTAAQRSAILTEAFGTNGFDFIRICMGTSDFCANGAYSYDDNAGVADPNLTNFSIARDTAYVIPVIQEILAINPRLKVIAAPWSPPGWLKSSGVLTSGDFTVSATNMTTWANYFVAFIQAYAGYGIPIWAMSAQNEPNYDNTTYPCCGWSAANLATFIASYLGPAFDAANITTKIWAGDTFWDYQGWATTAIATTATEPYLSGVAWHGYGGTALAQTQTTRGYPGLTNHFTEYCIQSSVSFAASQAILAGNIGIGVPRNYGSSITLWNFALDQTGNPVGFSASDGYRGVITVPNTGSGVIVRNPEYYVLAHLGKFVQAGAKRCASTTFATGSGGGGVESVAFLNPDGSVAVFLYNGASTGETVMIADAVTGYGFPLTMNAGDMTTVTWGPSSISSAGTLQAPSAPTSVAAVSSGGYVNLTWSAPASAGRTGIGGYLVYRATTSGAENGTPICVVQAGTLSYTDTSPVDGTTYYYKIAAFGGGGVGTSSGEVSITPVAVPPPAPAVTLAPGNGQIVLTFANTLTGGAPILSHNIYRGTTSGGETLLANTTAASPYTDSTAVNGTTYYYQITAVNSAGEGAKSVELPGTPATATNYLNGGGGTGSAYITGPIPSAMQAGTNPITVTALIQPASLSSASGQFIYADWPESGISANTSNASILFVLDSSGKLGFDYCLTSGQLGGQLSTVALPSTITQAPLWVRGALNPSTGACSYYTSPDGVNFTQLGTTVTSTATGTLNMGHSAGFLIVGAGSGGSNNDFLGKIYEVVLAVNGTTVSDLKFETAAVNAGTVTDSGGTVWHISSPDSIQ